MTFRSSAAIAALGLAIPMLRAASCAGCSKPAAAIAPLTTAAAASSKDTATAAAQTSTRQVELGPVRTTARTVVRRPDGTTIRRTIVREQGAVHVASSSSATELQEVHAEERHSSEVRQILPSPVSALPRWSFDLAMDNALAVALHGARPELRAAAGVRLVGPAWFRVTGSPLLLGRGDLGAGVALVGDRLALAVDLDNALAVAIGHASPLLRATGGVRLTGPLWVQLAGAPPIVGRGELGAGIAVRW